MKVRKNARDESSLSLGSTASCCVVCEEVITNPICSDCLATEIEIWLTGHNPVSKQEIDGYRMDGEISCIFCGSGMSICAHCFCKDIYGQIAAEDKGLAKEFMARFDYELRKSLV